MNCISRCATLAQSEQGHRTKTFRKSSAILPRPEAVAREAQISLLAFGAFSERADALAFLNGHSEVLNGRPLDAAGLSSDGLTAATAILDQLRDPLNRARGAQVGRVLAGMAELVSENPDRGRGDD